MNCPQFRLALLLHLDDILSEPERSAAVAHEAGCVPCAQEANLQRSVDARARTALRSSPAASERIDELLRAAAVRRSRPRPFLRRRMYGAAASVLVMFVGGAWALCIPPFECAYIEAVESAIHQSVPTNDGMRTLPLTLLGLSVSGPESTRAVHYRGSPNSGTHAAFGDGPARLDVLHLPAGGMRPSFRRHREIDGRECWIATRAGRTLGVWIGGQGALTAVLGPDEASVAAAANELLRRD